MTIGWEEVAAHTGAEMVGGDLIKFTPETGHVKLGGKNDRGQFTFTDAGQSVVLDMMVGGGEDTSASPAPSAAEADLTKSAAKAARAIAAAQKKAAAQLPSIAPVVEPAPAAEPEVAGLFDAEDDDTTLENLLG